MPIRELDDETVRKIAAGEVVERPASAVKELVENSLDAAASRIDVAVEAGGTEGIRVADDGRGMTPEAVELAVEKHTTSKIDGADDLAAIGTLGFRGEALHAIGSVSRTTITTKPRSGSGSADRSHPEDTVAEPAEGTELTVAFGEVTDVGPAGRPAGTTVEVTDLFGETPARRKFLKAASTEFDHVNRVVTRYAVANPDVSVSLAHDGREVFSTTGQGDLAATLLSVYGREVAEAMIPIEGEGVSGYVSHPETNRASRDYVGTYVNGRYVTASALREAVLDAYGAQLAPDRYPFAAVFLEVDPDAVDVNVHPRKLEVRFDDEGAVRERVRSAVRSALVDHGMVRSGAPRGKSAPAEATVRPGDEDRPASASTEAPGTTGDTPPTSGTTEPPAGESTVQSRASPTIDVEDDAPRTAPSGWGDGLGSAEPGTQRTLDAGRADERSAFRSLPPMRVLGQLDETFVVAEAGEDLVLIDQHAADERVHYERLRERLGGAPDSQALAEPVTVALTAREAELFDAHADALAELGFRAEAVDDREVEVRAVPAVFSTALPPDLVRDVLTEIVREREADTVAERADAILADLACHPAITGSTALTEGSVQALLSALDACENPYACPHGRPVIVRIDREEIDDRFERDYPGHAGRRPE